MYSKYVNLMERKKKKSFYVWALFQVILGLLLQIISVCRLRERGHMSKSVYVRVVHDLELLRYVLRCAVERQH